MGSVQNRLIKTDNTGLTEPVLTNQDWLDFNKGIRLFNQHKFWESHEVWEMVWIRHKNKNRLFFQGLIQLAAGLHQLKRCIYHGAIKHLENCLWKLEPFQAVCLTVDVKTLIEQIETLRVEIQKLGAESLNKVDKEMIPAINLVRRAAPSNVKRER